MMFYSACYTVLWFSSRSVYLDLVQTSMETGTTTGRRTIWLELSDTQESMMEITSITLQCCWQTSTKFGCLKADDTGMSSQKTATVCSFSYSLLKLTLVVDSNNKLIELLTKNNQQGKCNTATFLRICNPSQMPGTRTHRPQQKASCQQACYP